MKETKFFYCGKLFSFKNLNVQILVNINFKSCVNKSYAINSFINFSNCIKNIILFIASKPGSCNYWNVQLFKNAKNVSLIYEMI